MDYFCFSSDGSEVSMSRENGRIILSKCMRTGILKKNTALVRGGVRWLHLFVGEGGSEFDHLA